MSSSKGTKIVSGPSSEELEESVFSQADSTLRRDKETEQEFLQRVRERASDSAREIIEKAQAEAEEIKQKAYEEGLSAARKELEEQSAKLKQDFHTKFDSFLEKLQEEKEKLWDAHKTDMVQLIKLAVQKIVKKEIEESRGEILYELLDESLRLLDNRREITIYVNKEDLDLFQEALEQASKKFTHVGEWKIEESPNISPGGVLLENAESKVENSVAQRWEAVCEILDNIFDGGVDSC